jgi:hypothetical protein
MAHVLTVGQTETGKTLLTKAVARTTGKASPILVYDPTQQRAGAHIGGWYADFVTPSFYDFEAAYWNNTGCMCIVDEAPTVSVGEHRAGFRRMMMAGRHQGHVNWIIGQRPTAIDKNARAQCAEFRIFRIGRKDAEELANEIAAEQVANAWQLANGQFYHVDRKGRCELRRVF